MSDKPGCLKETVFRGDEGYKLKYNAAQARLFLRLLHCFLQPIDAADFHCPNCVSPVIIVDTVMFIS